MLLDFEVQRSTHRCAATGRTLEPGDVCYSTLEVQGADVVRKDFCGEAWNGPPQDAFAWWKSRVPESNSKKIKLAPNEVLLELFDELADRHEQADLRYVLTLLLIRRRVLRLEAPLEQNTRQTVPGECPEETMVVACPKREATYEVLVTTPDAARIDQIQQQLSELLVAGAD